MKIANFCILGRPNVGKSTFFNCLSRQKTVVKNEEGVTRDCNQVLIEYGEYMFYLTDTGGIVIDKPTLMQEAIKEQIYKIFNDLDAIFFMVDAVAGWLPEDDAILNFIRKSNKRFFLLANKIDNQHGEQLSYQLHCAGVEKIYPLSSAHKIGFNNLFEDLAKIFAIKTPTTQVKENQLSISLIGKTNVGKSSILNTWLGKVKMIVRDEAGTTRNSVSSEVVYKDRQLLLIDTAGIAKKSRVTKDLEKMVVYSSLQALKLAKIIILVVDCKFGLSEQDLKLASLAISKNKSLIIVFNKVDLLKNTAEEKKIQIYYKEKYPFLSFCPFVFVSAKTKKKIYSILDKVIEIEKQLSKRITTSDLNRILARIQTRMIIAANKKLKIFYCTQVKSAPPMFSFFVNNKKFITPGYETFIKNQLRYYFGFEGIPIKIKWEKK